MCSDDLTEALACDVDRQFERLVLAYQDRLYGFVLRLSGSPRDAEEITQDAFIRAYHALVRYPKERIQALALRPWLYQIALNAFRNARRGKKLAVTSGGKDYIETVWGRGYLLREPQEVKAKMSA